MKGNPRTRKTVMRVIEGKVDQDGAAFIQEQLNYIAPDMTVRSVDVISSRTCSFGHLQDQQTRLVASCEICQAYTCSAPGCSFSFSCCHCGRAVCKRHGHLYSDGEVYCSRCRPIKWLKMFFDIGKKEEKR